MAQDTSPGRSELSNEQMFKSIKVCMEQLVVEVSDMAETLAQLLQEHTMDSRMETI